MALKYLNEIQIRTLLELAALRPVVPIDDDERSAHRDYTRTQPRAEEWLLIEWPAGQAQPIQYWRLTLRKKTSLKKLVYLDSFRSGPIIKDEFMTNWNGSCFHSPYGRSV